VWLRRLGLGGQPRDSVVIGDLEGQQRSDAGRRTAVPEIQQIVRLGGMEADGHAAAVERAIDLPALVQMLAKPEQAGIEGDEAIDVAREDIDAGKDGHRIPGRSLVHNHAASACDVLAPKRTINCASGLHGRTGGVCPTGFGSVNYRSAFAQAGRNRTG
jgi:hypothetical protein